ncbi:MAG: cupin domain-containing protein [Eubacteriales bacterium]|nr:cupin domain-containing protein [Eubacteriales bacterium]
MNKLPWKLVNAENVEAFVCDKTYSSKMLTGDEMAGQQVININEGTLQPYCRTEGGEHDETELYYIVSAKAGTFVWLDNDCVPVKNGDIIVIPPHVFHWIDNTKSDEPFVLFTLWPKQEQNGVFFARQKAWGTSVRVKNEQYTQTRLQNK